MSDDWFSSEKAEGYDCAIVCENGHPINEHSGTRPAFNARFCKGCGAIGIVQCVDCRAPVRGNELGHWGGYTPPAHCHECGTAFVWTARKTAALQAYIDEFEDFDGPMRELLSRSIPDIIAATPMSDVAGLRWKTVIRGLKENVRAGVVKLLTSVACDEFKEQVGL